MVKIYSDTCSWCKKCKKFLTEDQIVVKHNNFMCIKHKIGLCCVASPINKDSGNRSAHKLTHTGITFSGKTVTQFNEGVAKTNIDNYWSYTRG